MQLFDWCRTKMMITFSECIALFKKRFVAYNYYCKKKLYGIINLPSFYLLWYYYLTYVIICIFTWEFVLSLIFYFVNLLNTYIFFSFLSIGEYALWCFAFVPNKEKKNIIPKKKGPLKFILRMKLIDMNF